MSLEIARRVTTWNIEAGSQQWPLIIAHRGETGVAPENTLPAFHRALDEGADGVELDVRLTRDDKLIVFHDRSLERTSDGHGLVDHFTLDELRSLDVGSWFSPAFNDERPPTLDQVFESLPRDYLLNVEMKVVVKGMKLIAQLVAAAIARHQRWASTLVSSFNPLALYYLRRIEPRLARGYIWSRQHPWPIRARFLSPLVQPHWYDPAHDSYSARLHRRFHRQRQRVLAWDQDFDGDLELMGSLRLDAVVTDNLATLVQRKRELSFYEP